jgi:putative ABC transport system permease protein
MTHLMPIARALWRHKGGALLIVAQVALTLAILCNALVVVLDRLAQADRPSGVAEADLVFINVETPGYDQDPFGVQRTAEALLRGIPGVVDAAWINQAPLAQNGSSTNLANGDLSVKFLNSAHYSMAHSPVKALGLKLVEGRDFTAEEMVDLDLRVSRQVPPQSRAIVTRALAEQLYPGGASAVGRRLRFGNGPEDPEITIVGVVDRLVSPWGRAGWIEGDPWGERSFITSVRVGERELYGVRAQPGQREQVRREAERRLLAAVPGRILLSARSQEQLREARYRGDRWLAGLLSIVTGALLVMTAAGIVGLASLWVAQRRKQIGVRRALGARRRDIVGHFVTENLLITGCGVVLGLTLAAGLNGLLTRYTPLPPLPPALLLGGALVMPLLGVLAVLGPALRAARVSPAEATRSAA